MTFNVKDLGQYVARLYAADNFEQAFNILHDQALKLGYEGVLYTYIPQILLESHFSRAPVYHVSDGYSPAYLKHYTEARFDQNDPLIKAVMGGVQEPVEWWGEINKQYMAGNKASREVIATANDYGISNGITLPLMSSAKGIAGASFISSERCHFNTLNNENLAMLRLCTELFHKFIIADASCVGYFLKPLLDSLSKTERLFLIGLAQGKQPSQIASKLNKSEKYLEQLMLKLRRKFSNSPVDTTPTLNRNQILYYVGLSGLLENID
ncbi:autoinducer binding domain-containing protein [Marinagarivorans cellulosilyticus]|uniref:Transcription factor LuxR-like autoinducer-binding domain-containing protein n=1 Tax=Marinagarivorans cellulosilyticus TaxID=2721545 RepID=A0AAN2BM53_9GAMM|nr:autoinducer binding domain-containing protein [Marinagarivorans cellulosilyticus]BCD99784.1 hypothetical protein MARGE09_P3986 [Marinagarivorans cellulosilyticus]